MITLNTFLSRPIVRRVFLASALAFGIGTHAASAQNKTYLPEKTDSFEIVADTTPKAEPKQKTLNFDAAIRRFEFFDADKRNLVTGSVGVSKSFNDKLSGYFMVQGGYDSKTQNPLVSTMGFLDYKYTNKPAGLSAELYHESLYEKDVMAQKVAVTPIKYTTTVTENVSICFDPRVALCYSSGSDIEPKVETLLTVSAGLTPKISAYWILQQYDAANVTDTANLGFNTGIVVGLGK